jgi:hypothetical protein
MRSNDYGFFIDYCCQRVRVWLVALAGTKLAKENKPEENPLGFSEYKRNQQLIIHVVTQRFFYSTSNSL